MAFHGGIPSPTDRGLMPRDNYEGTLPTRLIKRAVNFVIELAGGRRPFEPVQEGGAVAVARAIDHEDPLSRLPSGTIETDEHGIREQLPNRPQYPERN